jgi:hypothetical protein
MLLWLESQSIPVITVVVFAACYALAAVIFAAGVLISRWPVGTELKATTPVMMTPIGIITGLLIAFLASRVWTNLDHARNYVAQEASAIRETALLADHLPDDTRTAVHAAMKQYLAFIEEDDWPAMAAGRARLQRVPPGLSDALKAVLTAVPVGSGQQVAQQYAVVAIQRALEARRHRIVLSQATISPMQWSGILVLDALILLTITVVHIDRRPTAVLNLWTFSTAVAICLVLLLVHDRPFAAGGITVQPDALRDVLLD